MGQTKNSLYPLFWQHGEKEEELREEIGKMQEGGIGGFIVESRPHPGYIRLCSIKKYEPTSLRSHGCCGVVL